MVQLRKCYYFLVERKSLESFLQLLEFKCMALEEKPLYLRGGSIPKIEPCLDMLEFANSKYICLPLKLGNQ